MNETSPRPFLFRIADLLQVDRAVFYAVCLRVWQLLTGPISLLVIGLYLTPELQGFFYTFSSLLALQTFFELGLSIAVINVSSHEWLRLQLDADGAVAGDADSLSRLASLARLLTRWYAVAATLFFIGVGIGGAVFLAQENAADVAWRWPWVGTVLCAAGLLALIPYNALLEGCGQVAVVNRFRLLQAVTANLAVWTCMGLGGGLWACVVSVGMRLGWELALVLVRYRRFFGTLARQLPGPRMSWLTDIWPLQWRLAISGVLAYFAFSLFTPVMFRYHGAAVAGRMGMSWQLAFMLQALSIAWVQARAPAFGRLVAQRDFPGLDRLFFRVAAMSQLVVTCGAVVLWLAVWGLYSCEFRLATRLLEPLPTGLLLAAVVVYNLPSAQAFYIRAHKQEPLLPLNIVCCSLIGLAVWWLGRHFGPLGATAGYLAIVTALILPWQTAIWWSVRRADRTKRTPNFLSETES